MIAIFKQLLFGTVRRRLIFGVAMVHAVMMSAFIWDLNLNQQKVLLEQQQQQAQFMARSISLSSAGWLASRDVAGLQEIISAQAHGRDVVYAMALDPQGRILAHTNKVHIGQYVSDLPQIKALTVLGSNADLVDVVSPALLGNNLVGWIRVGIGQSHAHGQVASVIREGILYTLFAIAVGTWIAFMMGTRLTRRLQAISNTASAIMEGQAGQRVPVQGSDEAEQLAVRFNDMLDAIEINKDALQETNRELSSNKQLLVQAQNIARMGSWVFNVPESKLSWSDETYDIFGVDPRHVDDLYDTLVTVIHEGDRERVLQSFAQSIELGKKDYEVEHRILRPSDGRIRYIHEKCEHIRDETGQVVRSVGMAQDITDKVEAMSRIAENEQRLRAIFKTASDGIHIIRPDGTLIDASDSFLNERGYDDSALGRLKVWDWDPNFSREEIGEIMENLFSTDQSLTFETRHRHRDGHEFWVEVNCRGVNILGTRRIFASARDMTERKRAEAEREKLQAQLVQAQKMEAVGHLTGGIAHDFNNILGAILGYAQLMQMVGGKDSTLDQREYIQEILTAGNRAKDLVSQMLVFSRAQPDSAAEETPISLLLPLIKEVMQLLKSSIPSGIELELSIDDEDLIARIEPVHLHQILMNLVINARDAMNDYGAIDISVHREAINSHCNACHEKLQDEFVVISVTDTGYGMDPEIVSRIFDPFYTTKEVGKGTGMGLSVVHGLVHGVGGHVQVNSQPGAGSTISICLPLVESQDVKTTPSTTHVSGDRGVLTGLRVMLVDDEVMLCQMWGEVLGHHGAEVSVFTNPLDALRSFEQDPERADLVITDQNMPELSGSDMAKEMLRIRPNVPMILCTGHAENMNERKSRETGFAAFMQKPVDIQELLRVLQDLALIDRSSTGISKLA